MKRRISRNQDFRLVSSEGEVSRRFSRNAKMEQFAPIENENCGSKPPRRDWIMTGARTRREWRGDDHQIRHEIATRHAERGGSGGAGSFTRIVPERTGATLTWGGGGANIFHASLPVHGSHAGNAPGYDWSVCPVPPSD